MKPASLKNIRKEFKDKGIFYTPNALAKKLKSYVDISPKTVYDPTCGAGNLLNVFENDINKYGQELDPEQLSLIDSKNFVGEPGDTLKNDKFVGEKFDCIVANPPFSLKWNPDELENDERFINLPVMPPPSKADWAFMAHVLYHLADDGVAVVLGFPGILYRGQREGKIRRWFVESNFIDKIVNIPGNTFEDTSISTCIVVLKKNRKTTDVYFEDGERARTVSAQEIEANDFTLSVNTYIQDIPENKAVDIDEINKAVVSDILRKVDATFKTLGTLSEAFNDNFYIDELCDGLKNILRERGPL